MSDSQLNTLYKFEHDKETQAAKELQQAELEYQQNITRIESVAEFRLEYMKRLNDRSRVGIDSATYNHFHKFIAKLDFANEQVVIALKQAEALVAQRKRAWLAQRQKVQAVEILQAKNKARQQLKENRAEQRMYDEISTQQYIRKSQANNY
ncbi:MAG: flagellar export protein FliJ [Thalassotalea sp.]